MRLLIHQGKLELLVPRLVLDEYDRNRERVEATMTASIATRFKMLRQDLREYGGDDDAHAVAVVEDLSRHVPLIGAMTTRNFVEIRELLLGSEVIAPTEETQWRVVERGLSKAAPFHRGRNSVADALLIELYADAVETTNVYAFITTNSDDFSLANGDKRQPHADIAPVFNGTVSRYALGVEGLDRVLRDVFGDEIEELYEETDIREEPRRLDEISAAEKEVFERIWYHRALQREYRLEEAGDLEELERNRRFEGASRQRVEDTYSEPGMLGPYTDFELGMLHGKMSALRWVLGSEWDFLDT